jgi:hypothetical protein
LGAGAKAEIVRGKVVSAQGEGIELNVGAGVGVGSGDEGRVYYTILIDAKETFIFVGKFKVMEVSEKAARGQLTDRTGEIKAGYGVEIEIRLGELEVTSEPSGAAVYLDQIEAGQTPLALPRVRSGRHQVRVARQGHENWEREVEIAAGRKVEVYAQLKSREGRLEVRSEPAGAKVWVNGNEMGFTPLTMPVQTGQYLVRIFRDGYEVFEEWVQIEGGGRKEVRISLKRLLGDLSVQADPPGAAILLDGKSVGSGRYEGKGLAPKIYRLRVVKEGYENWERDVLVEEGKKVEVIARLGKKEKAIPAVSPSPKPGEKTAKPAAASGAFSGIDWEKKVWEAPIWKVGDKWTYKTASGTTWSAEVANVEGDWMSLKWSFRSVTSVYSRKTLNLDHSITKEGKKIEGSLSYLQRVLDFPLQIGKKWKNESPKNTFNSFEVEGVEKVTTPAGTFMAYRILYKQDKYEYNRLASGVFKVVDSWMRFWYSPEVKFLLKMEMEKEKAQYWKTQKEDDYELISFWLK